MTYQYEERDIKAMTYEALDIAYFIAMNRTYGWFDLTMEDEFNLMKDIFNRDRLFSPVDLNNIRLRKNGKFCDIEMKGRRCKMDDYSTIYIEPKKAQDILNSPNEIGYYLCFFEDGFILFPRKALQNLHEVEVTVNDPLHGKKTVKRLEIHKEDGVQLKYGTKEIN